MFSLLDLLIIDPHVSCTGMNFTHITQVALLHL